MSGYIQMCRNYPITKTEIMVLGTVKLLMPVCRKELIMLYIRRVFLPQPFFRLRFLLPC